MSTNRAVGGKRRLVGHAAMDAALLVLAVFVIALAVGLIAVSAGALARLIWIAIVAGWDMVGRLYP